MENGINALNMRAVWTASGIMLAVAVVGLIANILSYKLSAIVTSKFSKRLREEVFKKVNTLNPDQITRWGTGALITRSTQDIGLLEECADFLMHGVLNIPVLVVGGAVLAFLADPWLALIMFAFVPVVVFALYFVTRRIMPLWQKSDDYIDKQNSIIRERLTGIRVIRAFNRENRECERANEATEVMAENIIKANVNMGILTPLAMLCLNLVTVLIVFVGAKRMDNGSAVTGADIIALVQYVALVMNGIMTLAFMIAFLPKVVVNSRRINEVLETEVPAEPCDDGKPAFDGSVRFEHVDFAYDGASENALTDLNFSIKAGDRVAIIGGTGSGKSSVVRLLMKFFKPTAGNILFGDEEIRDISGKRVRDNVACVLQNASIFSGTLGSNIRMSDDTATDDEVMAAAEVAQIADFIKKVENGLEYEIQPDGTNLSGGQKQRLAIARAMLKNSAIYVFDDSFSALDFLTEANIKAALAEKLKGKTQIIVTQRAATAASCDDIIVLDGGKVVGEGKHKDLLKSCTAYREIYESQTGVKLDSLLEGGAL